MSNMKLQKIKQLRLHLWLIILTFYVLQTNAAFLCSIEHYRKTIFGDLGYSIQVFLNVDKIYVNFFVGLSTFFKNSLIYRFHIFGWFTGYRLSFKVVWRFVFENKIWIKMSRSRFVHLTKENLNLLVENCKYWNSTS